MERKIQQWRIHIHIQVRCPCLPSPSASPHLQTGSQRKPIRHRCEKRSHIQHPAIDFLLRKLRSHFERFIACFLVLQPVKQLPILPKKFHHRREDNRLVRQPRDEHPSHGEHHPTVSRVPQRSDTPRRWVRGLGGCFVLFAVGGKGGGRGS
ncbi:hypothetical protein B0T18DRAFT_396586 [Schizothecium vesticola]|uniref:Uncharacterized protein n=1 Tax=Schizothecium vesticola TaxID=314040 RepID=A0AA40KC35_9PEZI|nr:hypothetical protein B0T18DRAFT_396586 [Schizothecium vesticola]